jgi:hypothetical protein
MIPDLYFLQNLEEHMNKTNMRQYVLCLFIFHLGIVIDYLLITPMRKKIAIDTTWFCKRIDLEIWKKYKDSHRITK